MTNLDLKVEVQTSRQGPFHGKYVSLCTKRVERGKPRNYHIMFHGKLGSARTRCALRGGGEIYVVDDDRLVFVEAYGDE